MWPEHIRFLCDENIQSALASHIKASDLVVTTVMEQGLHGLSDIDILQYAHRNNYFIITHDSDFGKLVFTKDYPFHGIIYLRPGHFDPAIAIQSWESIIASGIEIQAPCIIVAENTGDNQVKIRYRQF